jgi:hypothetical protein
VQKERNAQQPKTKVADPAGTASDNEEFVQHEARPQTVLRDGYKGAGHAVDREKEAMACELKQLKEKHEAIEREREAMRDAVLCVVCLDGLKDTALSCGHQACARCAKALELCHICRQKITVRTRLY